MPIGFGFYTNDAPTIKEDAELRKENVTRILFTGKGERVNSPDFGSNLLKYLFNFENSIKEDIETEIISSLRKYQNELEVISIDIQRKVNTIKIYIVLLDKTNGETINYDTNIEVEQ